MIKSNGGLQSHPRLVPQWVGSWSLDKTPTLWCTKNYFTRAWKNNSRPPLDLGARSPRLLLIPEDVIDAAFQPVDDLLKFGQGDALLALLQTMQRGWRKPNLLRECFKRHLPTLSAQEGGEGLIQGVTLRKLNTFHSVSGMFGLIDPGQPLKIMRFSASPLMTCSECNNQIPENTTTCSNCGAPVEVIPSDTPAVIAASTPAPERSEQIKQSEDTPRLWNPYLIAIFELPLLGLIIASTLVALNWHRLKSPRMASTAWGFAVLVLVLAITNPFGWSVFAQQVYGFQVWLLIIALPQILHFRKHFPNGYTKRKWFMPIGVGLILQFGIPLINQYWADTPKEQSTAPAKEFTVEEVARYVTPLVVPVKTTWKESSLIVFTQSKSLMGSGVYVLRDAGYVFIVTNRHVVDVPKGATDVTRTLILNQKEMPYEVVAYPKNNLDLAMLRLPDPEGKATSMVPFLTTDELSVGQDCIAVGNTLGAGISVTTGIISRFDDMGNYTAIRTSAPISPGNSGGALFRRKDGRLIGITTQSSAEEHAQNVNIAIPMNYVLAKGALWDDLPGMAR